MLLPVFGVVVVVAAITVDVDVIFAVVGCVVVAFVCVVFV